MKHFKRLLIVMGLLICWPAAMQAQTPSEAPTEPDLTSLATKATEQGTVSVIVNLGLEFKAEGDLNPTEAINQQQRIKTAQEGVLAQLSPDNYTINVRFQYIPSLALTVNTVGLEELKALPQVQSVVEDRLNKVSLDRSTPLIGATNAWNYGYTGKGWTVAVLDTGVDTSHSFLQGRIASEACYSSRTSGSVASLCPNGQSVQIGTGASRNCSGLNGCEHGTHVAGIVAGKGSSFSGVAPEATLITIQVFSRINDILSCFPSSSCISAYDSSVLAGLERVYELRNTFKIASVNMSLGSGAYTNPCDSQASSYKAIIDTLRSVGIPTIIASGNDGYYNAISMPGCISTAISVGATNDNDGITDFSNRAYYLSLLAPGADIYSSIPGGGFKEIDGTSMAAPHVAGAWAIRKQMNATASVNDILAYFQRTAAPVYDPYSRITFERIQVDEEIPTPDMTLTASVNKTEAKIGDALIYTYNVQNIGSVQITLSGTDNHANTLTFSPNPLSPGQTATATVQDTIHTGDLPGPYIGRATVTGQGGGSSVQKTASKSTNLVALALTYSVDRTRAKVGDTVKYTYNVVNQGNVALTLTGQDEKSGALAFSVSTLSAGNNAVAISSYVARSSDLPRTLTNNMFVRGSSAGGTTLLLSAVNYVDLTQLLPLKATAETTQTVTTVEDMVTVDFPPTTIPPTATQFAYTLLGHPTPLPAVPTELVFDSAFEAGTTTRQTASIPLTFTLRYKDSRLPTTVNETELAVYHYDLISKAWLAIPSIITDTQANTVVFTSTELGQYALTGHPYTTMYYLPVIKK